MRRLEPLLLPVALLTLLAAGPARAQQAGHVSGVPAVRPGAGFRGGIAPHMPTGPHVVTPPMFVSPGRSFIHARVYGSLRNPGVNQQPPHGAEGDGDGNRRRFDPGQNGGQFYLYGYGNSLTPGFIGYPFAAYPFAGYPLGFDAVSQDQDEDGSQAENQGQTQEQNQDQLDQSPASQPGAYPAEPPPDYTQGPPPQDAGAPTAGDERPRDPYRPPYESPVDSQPVRQQPATILVFKDGRPNEEVRNYVLTSTALYNLDGERRRELPLSEIDVPATVDANRTAGVDFALPAKR